MTKHIPMNNLFGLLTAVPLKRRGLDMKSTPTPTSTTTSTTLTFTKN